MAPWTTGAVDHRFNFIIHEFKTSEAVITKLFLELFDQSDWYYWNECCYFRRSGVSTGVRRADHQPDCPCGKGRHFPVHGLASRRIQGERPCFSISYYNNFQLSKLHSNCLPILYIQDHYWRNKILFSISITKYRQTHIKIIYCGFFQVSV